MEKTYTLQSTLKAGILLAIQVGEDTVLVTQATVNAGCGGQAALVGLVGLASSTLGVLLGLGILLSVTQHSQPVQK